MTFNTPFGRFRFLRVPFGISSASEVFQKILAQILEGLDGCVNSIDDILVYADTKEEHDIRLRKVLDRLREYGIKLKRSKCKVGLPKLKYIGVILTGNGAKTDPDKVTAVQEMPYPTDKKSLQRFLGMVTYFGKFIPNLSSITTPLRELLKKEIEWHWTEVHGTAIDTLKTMLTNAPVLAYYDPKKDITVTADASKDGIGAAILQDGHPFAFASRALTQSEKNYAQIEKETLGVTFACKRFHQYLYGGRIFTVQTDHKPLVAIINKPLFKAPPRIQRFLLRLQRYNFNLVHVPGKHLLVADTLSRAYLTRQEKSDLEREVNLQIHLLVNSLAVSKDKREQIQTATSQDPELCELSRLIQSGWPEHRRDLPPILGPYWQDKEEFHTAEGIVFKGSRIVVPETMRIEMLSKIHEGHFGIDLCTRRAKELLFWPGMIGQIADKIGKCATCQKFAKKQSKEPLKLQETPDRPWQNLASDLFVFHCEDYLLIVDTYSGFFEIEMLEDTTASTVISHMKRIFARHGIPESLLSDNGPQFDNRKFHEFAEKWGFVHKTSSPLYPRSNGLAERTVQTAKNILKKAKNDGKDPYLALMTFRDTPRGDGLPSPAQLLYGRKLRTQLPVVSENLDPAHHDLKVVRKKLSDRQNRIKLNHDQRAMKTPLSTLQPGSNVRLRQGKHWIPAEIISHAPYPRSYNGTRLSAQSIRY
jgi:transposase InsO family protein